MLSGALKLIFISLILRLVGSLQFAFRVKSSLLKSYRATKVGNNFKGSMLKFPSREYWRMLLWPILGNREMTLVYSNS